MRKSPRRPAILETPLGSSALKPDSRFADCCPITKHQLKCSQSLDFRLIPLCLSVSLVINIERVHPEYQILSLLLSRESPYAFFT